MAPKQAKRVMALLTALRDNLGLQGWTLRILDAPPSETEGDDNGAFAEVTCTPGRKVASFRFCLDFMALPRDEMLNICVHEMLHLHWSYGRHATAGLYDAHVLSQSAFSVFDTTMHYHEEFAVDALATALDELLATLPSVQKALRKLNPERTAP